MDYDLDGGVALVTGEASGSGARRPSWTHQYPVDRWDRIVAVNLRGTWLSMRAVVPALLAAGGGAIVNVAATLGLRGAPFASPYSASKHAVIGHRRGVHGRARPFGALRQRNADTGAREASSRPLTRR